MSPKMLAVILTAALSIKTVLAQSFNKNKLDSFLNILAEKNKAMGSLAISKNGKVLYSRAMGHSFISDREKIPATVNTKYRIGSISKMFTAVMIFQLIEEGKLSLTATLDKYFPQVPSAKLITISNLLNHRSGLRNFTNDQDYTTWMSRPKTQDEMIAIISKNKVDFEPNEKASYSNSNYVLLGYILEKISKQSYSKNLVERITSKIDLSNTYVGANADAKNNESFSYQFINNWNQEPETDMSIPGGAGSIVSTPTDLTKFIEALFSLILVNKKSLTEMKTITDNYGMGMFQMPFYNKRAYGHNGGIDGFASNLAFFPEDSVAVAYCTNGQVYPINDILLGALSIYFDKKFSVPTFNTITLKTGDLDRYLGIYSSTQFPLKITITKDNTTLFAQASGQSSFPLEATEKDKFKFDQAGVELEFHTGKNEMILRQGGGQYLFTKEK